MKKLVVIAHNIRSLHNVGSIFRTAEGAGVNKLYLTGYTGHPPRKEISKVALGSENRLPWEFNKSVTSVINQLKKDGFLIVALEQNPKAINYNKFSAPRSKVALIVGNEVRGVSPQLLNKTDKIIEIPMLGARKSLNVAVAFGIATFELKNKK